MGRKKRKNPVLKNLEITDIGAEGKAIARHDGKVVFITMGIPGDVVDIQVSKQRKKYYEGYIIHYHQRSDKHIEPVCSHFGMCGGCKWQHLPYTDQLKYKQQQVLDNVSRIGKVNIKSVAPIIPSAQTTFYRNKLEYTFSASRWISSEEIKSGENIDRRALGFHVPGKFNRVIDITNCYLQDTVSDNIRNFLRDYAFANNFSFYNQDTKEGQLRNLSVRTSSTGEVMVTLIHKINDNGLIENIMQALANEFPDINALFHVFNDKVNDSFIDLEFNLFKGKDHIIEKLEDLKFKIGPKSFFQTNTFQALELYKKTKEMAGLTGNEVVYDLYTGTGSIANFVARNAQKVIGIEYIEEAIADARINSEINGISNTLFFAGDMKDILTPEFVATHGHPNVVITDPPRAGMYASVVECLLNVLPNKIVYVSCNPATQARDIEMLNEKYTVTHMQPVDMFPHTHHVENITLLELTEHIKK